jgi:hypothetical protein
MSSLVIVGKDWAFLPRKKISNIHLVMHRAALSPRWWLLPLFSLISGCVAPQRTPTTATMVVWPRSVAVSPHVEVRTAAQSAIGALPFSADAEVYAALVAEADQTMVRPQIARRDYELVLRDKGGTLADIARREFLVAIKRGRYFPVVTGAVPITSTDRDTDVDPIRGAGSARPPSDLPSSAQGTFELAVKSWGFHWVLGRKVRPAITLEATLRNTRGELVAREVASTNGADLPAAPPETYLNSPRALPEAFALAAKAASGRVLDALARDRERPPSPR